MTVYESVDPGTRREQETAAIECRASRHWWQRQESAPFDWKPSPLFMGAKNVLHFECMRCGTTKHTAFNHLGTEPITRYDWPDWYRREGEGRMTGEQLRLWQVKQVARLRRDRRKADR